MFMLAKRLPWFEVVAAGDGLLKLPKLLPVFAKLDDPLPPMFMFEKRLDCGGAYCYYSCCMRGKKPNGYYYYYCCYCT